VRSIDRTRLPAVGPDPAFRFPEIRKRHLPNGLEIWTAEHRSVPVVTLVLLLRVGSATDPPHRPGLASLTGDMLDEGAGDRSALEVNDALARIGAQFDTEVGPDATILTVTTLARFTTRALELLADMAVRPQFDEHEFARVRELRANRLRQLRDVPSAVADRAFAALVYGTHPYGHLAIGSEEALQHIGLDEVRAFHRRAYRPLDATLIAVGDATHDELADAAAAQFTSWDGGAARDNAIASAMRQALVRPPARSRRFALLDRPSAAQSELRMGHVAVPRSTPDYHALVVLNMVLGGQFVSRINMNLREDKGFTYGARTAFDFRLGPGPFQLQVSVQTAATAAAIQEVLSELEGIRGARPVTDRELDLARAALTRGYPRNFETAEQLARSSAQLALYGLPDDYFERFVPAVAALDLDALARVASTYVQPDQLATLIVGDRSAVEPTLEGVDLGAADLSGVDPRGRSAQPSA
jgi:predicted Zn-dependent peptidase